MSAIKWSVVIAEVTLLAFPLLWMIIKYAREIMYYKRMDQDIDHEIILKLIAASISFTTGLLVLIFAILSELKR